MKQVVGVAPTLALLASVLLIWEASVRIMGVPAFLLPAPSTVAARLFADPLFFVREGLVTLGEALGGLVIGGVLAFGAGLLMARWRWLERALLPVAIVAKVTPVVVVAPLFVLWFGFGPWPRLLIAALLAFFPILIGAVAGLRAVPTAAHDVLLTLDASATEEAWLRRVHQYIGHDPGRPGREDQHAVSQPHGLHHAVRDEQRRRTTGGAHCQEQIAEPLTRQLVQAGERLVQEQQLWL